MARYWNNRWKTNRWESKDPWQNRDQEQSYAWLKKTVVAGMIFTLVYGAQASNTAIGLAVVEGVRQILTVETDFAYIADQLAGYAPKNVDISVLKKVQNTVSRPADPLLYMTQPVEGKLAVQFGWQVNPVNKQETMHEGVAFDATLGAPVRAAAAGKVKAVTDSARYGRTLIIQHSQEVDTIYGYLGEVLVKQDEAVSQGQVVARVGKNGSPGTAQLYFEVREKGKATDPLSRIKGDIPGKEGK